MKIIYKEEIIKTMEERVYELVKNTLKKDDALEIIAQRILWYEMQLIIKEERIDKAIEYIEENMKEEYIHTDYIYEMIKILRGKDNE